MTIDKCTHGPDLCECKINDAIERLELIKQKSALDGISMEEAAFKLGIWGVEM